MQLVDSKLEINSGLGKYFSADIISLSDNSSVCSAQHTNFIPLTNKSAEPLFNKTWRRAVLCAIKRNI